MQREFLTDEGKKWARYIFLSHHYTSNIPFFGKWIAATAVSLAYSVILKEGAKENARRKQIAKVSRMRNRVSLDRGETARELREMRLRAQGLSGLQTMERSAREGEDRQEKTNGSGEEI